MRPQKNLRPFHWFNSLFSTCAQFWQRWLTSAEQMCVSQQVDQCGNFSWTAYNPKTRQSTQVGSEREVRAWIEQQYYQ